MGYMPTSTPGRVIFGVPQMRSTRLAKRKDSGFTLITTAMGIITMLALVGLAVDIGRMYIAKSESQTYVDSASLAATMELDGTDEGIDRARIRAAANPNRWNFNASTFSSVTTSFAKVRSGPWEENPLDPEGYRFARAATTVDVPIYFLSVFQPGQIYFAPQGTAFISLAAGFTAKVKAVSGAGQELKQRFGDGTFPFSPLAHDNIGPNFGLIPGELYTLRWASNPRLGNNTCPGDDTQAMIDLANSGGGSERGYIEETSASVIRQAITGDYQTAWRGIGDTVNMTGGSKQTQLTSLIERVAQDTNSSSPNYQSYTSTGTGNGRRIVGAPINSGSPNYTVVQIGAFYLRTAGTYENGGNSPWCAEYIGPWLQGSTHKGASEVPGAYVVRITE